MKENLDPISILLPEGILDHFALVDVHKSDKDYHLFLDELSNPPSETGYHSKGFTEQAVVQDFPLRGKPVYLHIRRRKWLNIKTHEIVTSTFD
ncbi:MAG: transposase family protein, partial [Rikenellaceae bacterium]